MTSTYNRSEIYSFYDLTEEQKENVLSNTELEDAANDSYVIFKGEKFTEALPLSMFMRINYGSNINNKPLLWDGIYSTSAFSGYYIKLAKDNSEAVIAERYC